MWKSSRAVFWSSMRSRLVAKGSLEKEPLHQASRHPGQG